jgi:membrane protease YdiL (CAAX protease family)
LLRGRYGPLLATLAIWPVWTCWHLPSFLMRPEFALGAWLGFSLGILAASAWSTLLYDKTRSVLMIAIWHALINITRNMAGAASTDAFFAFAQAMLAIGLCVIVYWLFTRPGKYSTATSGA